ncbi:MAG: hypothetical protein H7A25_21370 [Leptospiraceae bacterium]|nr:hypothetical protein [Leptospiraceae bacterium]MCP5502462.1 hypothetical protein [Leptospiraceae bacterium]
MTQEDYIKITNIEKATNYIQDRIRDLKLRKKGTNELEIYSLLAERAREILSLAEELSSVGK